MLMRFRKWKILWKDLLCTVIKTNICCLILKHIDFFTELSCNNVYNHFTRNDTGAQLNLFIKSLWDAATCLPLPSFAPVFRLPVETFGINPDGPFCHAPFLSLNLFIWESDNILTLVVVDEIEVLQCGYDIIFLDACQLWNFTARHTDKTKMSINHVWILLQSNLWFWAKIGVKN